MPSLKSCVRPLAFGIGALLGVTMGAVPTVAQYYPVPRAYPPAPPPQIALAPHHADAVVRLLGLIPVGRAQAHGSVFVVRAIGQEGTQVQVTLDRRSGRVMEIMRIGPGAPRIARLPPPPRGPYDVDDDEFDIDEDDELYPPLVRGQPLPRNSPAFGAGPTVITREGIASQELPPPGAGPRMIERDSDITGSVPRRAERGPVDPLLGVPKEFRGQQQRGAAPGLRTAARSPAASISRTAPLPRPRPADAPTVAQSNAGSQPVAVPAVTEPSMAAKAKEDAEKFPPVQPLE